MMLKQIWMVGWVSFSLACGDKSGSTSADSEPPETADADAGVWSADDDAGADADADADPGPDTGSDTSGDDTAASSNPDCEGLAAGVQLKIHSPYTQNPGAVPTWARDDIIWLNMTVLNCGDERFEHDAGFNMEFDPEIINFEPAFIWGGPLDPGESSTLKVTFRETATTDQGQEIDVVAKANHAACYHNSEDCSLQTSFPMTFTFDGDLPYFEGEEE
jgi:hypothetical protein